MPDREPLTAEPLVAGAAGPRPWAMARDHLEGSTATYWLATVRPNGTPHVMPVLAVWVDGGLFLSAGGSTRKAKNLARYAVCVVTVEEEPLDLVVEGTATKVRHEATLQSVAEAYASTYDWHVTVRDGAFHATGGASTAGPPPYDVYEVRPTTAFSFGTDGTFHPTRWRFGDGNGHG
jgi:hypothetical protein